MLVQRLIEYTNREGLLQELPKGYASQTVNWIADIDENGKWMGGGYIPQEKGRKMITPTRSRSGTGQNPILLYDKASYALGYVNIDKEKNKTEEQLEKLIEKTKKEHDSFCVLLRTCVEETQNLKAKAVLKALESNDRPPFPEEMKPGDWIVFRVADEFPYSDKDIQRFWAKYTTEMTAAKNKQQDVGFICIGCGERCVPVSRHRIPIKIRGGQSSGAKLISANSAAFYSHGLEESIIAPMCESCSEKYGKGLTNLLASENNHVTINNLTYIFWTKEKTEFSFNLLLNAPDPLTVQELLKVPFSAKDSGEVDTNLFYAAALSPNNARIAVRDWMETTVSQVQEHLVEWFNHQRLGESKDWKFYNIYALSASLYQNPSREMVPNVPLMLLKHALNGNLLPFSILQQTLLRCVAERSVTRPRAVLIKLFLLQSEEFKEGDLITVDITSRDPAYLCGRMLAHLEHIQTVAVNPNATLVDRYYATASTAPASVFPYLIKIAQYHLSKIRKDKRGYYVNLTKELESITENINEFPSILTLKEQGLFALGYYHQRHLVYQKNQSNTTNKEMEESENEKFKS